MAGPQRQGATHGQWSPLAVAANLLPLDDNGYIATDSFKVR